MITVEYKNFEEMVDSAKNLIQLISRGQESGVRQQSPAVAQTTTQPETKIDPAATDAPHTQPYQSTQTAHGAVLTSTANYTQDDLARAAIPLVDSGRQAELITLLNQFGVDSLVALSPNHYGAFATALRGLGAKI